MQDNMNVSSSEISIEDILMNPNLEDNIEDNLEDSVEETLGDHEILDGGDIDDVSTIKTEDVTKPPVGNFEEEVEEENLLTAVTVQPIPVKKYAQEPKVIHPPTMDVAIVNDPDELLQGADNSENMVKQLMSDPTKNDVLCTMLKQEDNTSILLGSVMGEIAEELAYLKAYRRIHYIAGENISDVSLKRTKALESLVKSLVEKDKLKHVSEGKIDFYGERFEKVMEFILTVVKEAFDKVGIPDQFSDIFFVQLAQDLEGFEKKVDKIYNSSPYKSTK
jgi:hypothetical protein